MLDRFDWIRIINLPQRHDRRAEMIRELARLGLADDARVAFFEAIRPAEKGDFYSVGAHGVYLSHLAILREAAGAGASVLILEDDCHFTPAAQAGGDAVVAGEDWDIFYGGHYAQDPDDLVNSDIIGAHMMGFTSATAGRICDYLDHLHYEGGHPPIDGAYVWFRRAHRDVRTRFAVPPLAVQRPSRSDIAELRIYDRIALIRPLIAGLRRLRAPR